jgi:hypothetical protein
MNYVNMFNNYPNMTIMIPSQDCRSKPDFRSPAVNTLVVVGLSSDSVDFDTDFEI